MKVITFHYLTFVQQIAFSIINNEMCTIPIPIVIPIGLDPVTYFGFHFTLTT